MAEPIVIKITGKADDFKKTLNGVKGDVSKLEEGLANAAKISAAAIAAVGAAAIGIGVKAIDAYRGQELATNQLNQALVQQGIFSRELANDYQKMASELQGVTLFGDEATIAAQAQLQAYLGQTKITKELTAAIQDFAAAQGVDLKTAADLVGKSIGSSTNALARYGIQIDTSASKSEKLSELTKVLNDRFGGQAQAAASGLGALTQLSNTVGDIFEVLGEKLAPTVITVTKELNKFALDTQSNQAILNGLVGVIDGLVVGFLFLKQVVTQVGGAIGVGLASAVESVVQLTQGNFTAAKDIAAQGIEDIQTLIRESNATFDAELQGIEDEKRNQEELRRQEDANRVKQSLANNQRIKTEANKTAITAEQRHLAEMLKVDIKGAKNREEAQKIIDEGKVKAQQDTFSKISTLAGSNNKVLAAIGKAAALVQIAIDGPIAVTKALAAFPPPLNFVAAGAVGAAVAAQAARVVGVQFAEGGLVEGGIHGKDSVNALLMPNELVVPRKNFDDVVSDAANRKISEQGFEPTVGKQEVEVHTIVEVQFAQGAERYIDARIKDQRALGVI